MMDFSLPIRGGSGPEVFFIMPDKPVQGNGIYYCDMENNDAQIFEHPCCRLFPSPAGPGLTGGPDNAA
jgi:hypothetical protein